jgi:hypothetical protein
MDKRRHRHPSGALQLLRSLLMLCSLIFLSAVASGCDGNGDECSYGDVRCLGNTAQSCERRDGAGDYWQSSSCGDSFCKTWEEEPPFVFCAQSSSRTPVCGRGVRSLCRGNEVVDCRDGYVVHTLNCTTGRVFPETSAAQPETILENATARTGYCRSAVNIAFCSLDPEPTPVCKDLPETSVCSENTLVICSADYAIYRHECTRTCSTNRDGVGYCD